MHIKNTVGAVIGREKTNALFLTDRGDPFAATDRSYKPYTLNCLAATLISVTDIYRH
ncbi:hypothetical protein [Pseudomonas sp. UBA6276]|uniref:hypothetical protein n=1 Tax=Pseudomonas sp. UBA6276 TaxID=1947324 RepID=UPI00258059F0|nr:hypothetical protein [Pseudomonas sp. UBA6276]